jgi:hypothetical protein
MAHRNGLVRSIETQRTGVPQVTEQPTYLPLRVAFCRRANSVAIGASRMRFLDGDKR